MAERQAPKNTAKGKIKPKDGDQAETDAQDAADGESGADEAENDADEEDEEGGGKAPAQDASDLDPETGLNRPVEGFTPVPQPKPNEEGEIEVPAIPDGKLAVLDSPSNFGIHIGGLLHQFKKGKTPLSKVQYEACIKDSYVADNGAQVVFMNDMRKAKPKPKK